MLAADAAVLRAADRLDRTRGEDARRGAENRPGALGNQPREFKTTEVRPPLFFQVGWLCSAAALARACHSV